MKIKSFRFLEKKLRLKEELKIDSTTSNIREVFFIILETEKGITGIGEAVILESHGTESKIELLKGIEYLSDNIFDFTLYENFFKNRSFFEFFNNKPALRTALEQALFNICLNLNKNLINQLFNTQVKSEVPVNFLIPNLSQELVNNKIKESIKAGYNTIKIKLGINSFDQDLKKIQYISNKFPELKLRIDPNCGWKLDEIKNKIKLLEAFPIEYIEQPCKKTEDIIKLQNLTSIDIAADESAFCFEKIKLLVSAGIKTIILKPMTVGGILNSIEIIKFCESKNVKTIITSSIESNFGLQIPVLISAVTLDNFTHGLNISNLFSETIAENKCVINSGKILTAKFLSPIGMIDE